MKFFALIRGSESRLQKTDRKLKGGNDNITFANLQFKELVKKNLTVPMKLYNL